MGSTVFHFDNYDDYGFDECPKKDLVTLNVNPYNGNVVMQYGNHRNALDVLYQLLNQIMEECTRLEEIGSLNPLEDFIKLNDGDKGLIKALQEQERQRESAERMMAREMRRYARSEIRRIHRLENRRCF